MMVRPQPERPKSRQFGKGNGGGFENSEKSRVDLKGVKRGGGGRKYGVESIRTVALGRGKEGWENSGKLRERQDLVTFEHENGVGDGIPRASFAIR